MNAQNALALQFNIRARTSEEARPFSNCFPRCAQLRLPDCVTCQNQNAIISILVSIPIKLSIGLFRQEYELQFDMYVTKMRTGLHVEIFSESGMYF